jgi:hypothetical protein
MPKVFASPRGESLGKPAAGESAPLENLENLSNLGEVALVIPKQKGTIRHLGVLLCAAFAHALHSALDIYSLEGILDDERI